MKYIYKAGGVFAIGVLLVYMGCKKTESVKVNNKTASEKTVAGIVATNLANSLAGNYGGVNVADGIKPPTAILASSKNLVINSLNSLCGFTVDTSITYKFKMGDSIKSVIKGRFVFTYTCSGAFPDGYKVSTDFVNAGYAPTYSFRYALKQVYTVQALNAQYTQVSLNGSLISNGEFTDKPASYLDTNFVASPIFQHQKYILTNLTINVATLDIISGTSTFVSTGSNSYGSWNYQGTITYLGNHKAKITINGHDYLVDMTTGITTPL